MIKYRTHRVSCDQKYMFAGSRQPTDVLDDSNMKALSYSTKSCAMHRFNTSAFAGVCHSTENFDLHFNIKFMCKITNISNFSKFTLGQTNLICCFSSAPASTSNTPLQLSLLPFASGKRQCN